MSATARTEGQRAPDGLDFYETPAWAVQVLLRNVYLPPWQWLDPCAGTGAIPRAVGEHGYSVLWTNVEIDCTRADVSGAVRADFFEWHREPANFKHRWDVAIFNPPFPMAEQFVRACLPIADHVVCLQRINWAAKRGKLLDEHPADVWMLPDRPAFGLNKHGRVGTDATEYAWFYFHKEARGLFRVLPRAPKGDLKAANARIRSMAKAAIP